MSAGWPRKSPAAWAVCLAAVPVLYLLSIDPVIAVAMKGRKVRRCDDPPPAWLFEYMRPAGWLYENTPLSAPMDAYSDLWARLLPAP